MSRAKKIHLIEDDADLRELIQLAGVKNGYEMRLDPDGLKAKQYIEEHGCSDLIILDINMPVMDGYTFCRWLREDYPLIPVIFLSARAEEYDRILGLEIGGDDYLTKPFSMKELFARIAVALRRVKIYNAGKGSTVSKDLDGKGLIIDTEAWECNFKGHQVTLTVTEFRILHRLSSNPGVVYNRDQLASTAFPEDHYNNGRGIDVHISRIRRKLEKIDSTFSSIETVYQIGYKWIP